MRKYLAVVRAELVNRRQFALDFALQSVRLPIAVLILLYIYQSVSGGTGLGGYSALKLSLYYVGVAVSGQVLAPAYGVMWESWEQINNGDLANYLCRPVDYLWFRYARQAAPAGMMAVCAVLIQAVVSLIRGTWSPVATLQFFVALLLSFSLWFMWWFFMGALTFWWERPFGLRDILWSLIGILSGQVLPIDLLHPALQPIIRWLPFQGLAYVPAALFAGSLNGLAAWVSLGQQFVWLAALIVMARTLWGAGVRTYDGRGG